MAESVIKKPGVVWKTIATAAAGQTYAAQLAALKPVYMSFSLNDRASIYLCLTSWCKMPPQNVSTGTFIRIGGDRSITYYDITNMKVYQGDTDISNNINPDSNNMSLQRLDAI